jgi:hypothetical protein
MLDELIVLSVFIVLGLGRKGIFLSIVLVWWIVWLSVVSISPTGLYIPSNTTFIAISSFLAAAFMGGILARIISKKILINARVDSENKAVLRAEARLKKILLYICLPIMLIILMRALPYIADGASYRGEIYGGDLTATIFGSTYGLLAYILFLKLFLFVGLFLGITLIFSNQSFSLFFICILMILLDSLIFVGRADFVMIMIVLLTFVSVGVFVFKLKSRLLGSIISITIFALGSILFISVIRSSDLIEIKLIELFIDNVIHNFSVGLVILSLELSDSSSSLNTVTTYGFAFFGRTLEYFFIFLRRLSEMPDLHTLAPMALSEWRTIGINDQGNNIGGNAYATVFYSLLSDGGIFLALVASFCYGFFLVSKTSNCWFNNKDGVTVLVLLFIGIGGVTFAYSPAEILLYLFVYILLTKKYSWRIRSRIKRSTKV